MRSQDEPAFNVGFYFLVSFLSSSLPSFLLFPSFLFCLFVCLRRGTINQQASNSPPPSASQVLGLHQAQLCILLPFPPPPSLTPLFFSVLFPMYFFLSLTIGLGLELGSLEQQDKKKL
jgi:hypothetical protein